MEDYLYHKDLWKLLEGKTKNQGTMTNEEWEILDKKALGSIQLCLTPSVALNITKVKMTKKLMKTLEKLYEKPSSSNKLFIMKILINMKMKMEDYLYQKDLWKLLEGKNENQGTMTNEEWEILDIKELGSI